MQSSFVTFTAAGVHGSSDPTGSAVIAGCCRTRVRAWLDYSGNALVLRGDRH